MAQQQDLFLLQVLSEEFTQLGAIGDDALQRHLAGARAPVAAKSLPHAAAVPLDDGEVALPGSKPLCEGHVGGCRSAVHNQDHGIAPILASDSDPLLDATELHEMALIDAVRTVDSHRLRQLPLPAASMNRKESRCDTPREDDARENPDRDHVNASRFCANLHTNKYVLYGMHHRDVQKI